MKNMKKWIFAGCFGILFSLGAEDAAPILNYDFTAPVIVQGGRFQQPKYEKTPEIEASVPALKLAKRNFLTIPDSRGLSVQNGMTFHAVVKFRNQGTDGKKSDSYDMIFFKPGEFLFGRDCRKLYFNVGNGNLKDTKWMMPITAPDIPCRRWTALTAALAPVSKKVFNVTLYIDGKKAVSKQFYAELKPANNESVTIGKGWGGPWFMEGEIASVRIYDRALSPDQIAELATFKNKLEKGDKP